MANVFLNKIPRDLDTAIMLENAYIYDIGESIAHTDGNRIFINTDENLTKLLPEYNDDMLKWLLWHERFHVELKHHQRYNDYIAELHTKAEDEFQVTLGEVNIIMDILVHDSLSKMFPELVELARKNFAQMRDKNSLGYLFTTYTLEEMLDEYKKHKQQEDKPKKPDDKDKKQDDKPQMQDDKDKKDTSEQEDNPVKQDDKPRKQIDSKEFISPELADKYKENKTTKNKTR